MRLPKSYSSFLKLIVEIAENGNPYYDKKATEQDQLDVGSCVADIQNWCGENRELLAKFNLKYHG